MKIGFRGNGAYSEQSDPDEPKADMRSIVGAQIVTAVNVKDI